MNLADEIYEVLRKWEIQEETEGRLEQVFQRGIEAEKALQERQWQLAELEKEVPRPEKTLQVKR